MISTLSQTLNQILETNPPKNLYHYTSPAGLIGMLQYKEIWATNISFMNDVKEIDHAVDLAKFRIEDILDRFHYPDEEVDLLKEMKSYAGSAGKRIYIFSLSEEGDQLSQWRSYCPPNGGYAIGFPSIQLKNMAAKQIFFLCPCVYDHEIQYNIVCQFIDSFLKIYRNKRQAGLNHEQAKKDLAWEFGQYIAEYGPIIKHKAFYEEKEWRLISGIIDERNCEQVKYRASNKGIIPYFNFDLIDEEYPNIGKVGDVYIDVVIGPNSNPSVQAMAVQFFLTKYVANITGRNSSIPYKNW